MVKWEYTQHTFDRQHDGYLIDWLNTCGEDGWEAFDSKAPEVRSDWDDYTFLFKRLLVEPDCRSVLDDPMAIFDVSNRPVDKPG